MNPHFAISCCAALRCAGANDSDYRFSDEGEGGGSGGGSDEDSDYVFSDEEDERRHGFVCVAFAVLASHALLIGGALCSVTRGTSAGTAGTVHHCV